jgi:hypothetical protein
MKPFFDPIFASDDLPVFTYFFPDEAWYKEQKLALALSLENGKPASQSYPASQVLRIIFWEAKPAKFIALLVTFILLLLAFKPLLSHDLFTGLTVTAMIVLFIATCYAFNNYMFVVEYFIREARNRIIIKNSWQTSADYQSFIIQYNKKRYFKLPEWLLTAIVLLLLMLLFAVLIAAMLLVWYV